MRFRNATADDLAEVEALLTASKLPVDGVAEHLVEFIVAEDEGSLAGVIGLERYGSTALLRSAAVVANARGVGIGSRLVNAVMEKARASGISELYLLTTTAEDYFPKFGFEHATRDDVPAMVKQSAEFRGACPDTAVVMRHVLDSRAPSRESSAA